MRWIAFEQHERIAPPFQGNRKAKVYLQFSWGSHSARMYRFQEAEKKHGCLLVQMTPVSAMADRLRRDMGLRKTHRGGITGGLWV